MTRKIETAARIANLVCIFALLAIGLAGCASSGNVSVGYQLHTTETEAMSRDEIGHMIRKYAH